MREIKAYIQRSAVSAVVRALEEGGAPGITIVEIHPVGYGYEPRYFDLGADTDEVLRAYRHLSVVKIEVVCTAHHAERFVEIIRKHACTGSKGDGMIFVSDVESAVRIRDGAHGVDGL